MVEKRKPEKPSDKAKRKRDRELNDIRAVLSRPEGRRFIWNIMSEAQIFHEGYVAGDQGYGTTRFAGRKGIGLWVLKEILEAKPEAFTQMQREHASELAREKQEYEQYVEEKSILETDE